MAWRKGTPPLSRQRLAALYSEWVKSVGSVCVTLAFFFGISLVTDPLFRTVPATSTFHIWGEAGLFVIGLIFMGVAVWDTLISSRPGYTITVVVLCGFGILSALHPFSVSGMIFYVLALVATFHPAPIGGKQKEDTDATSRV